MKKYLLFLALFFGTTAFCHVSKKSYANWLDAFDKRLRAGKFGQALDNFILLEGAFEYDQYDEKSKKSLVDYLKTEGFFDQKDYLSNIYLNNKYNHWKTSFDTGAPLSQAEFALFNSEANKISRIVGWNRIKIIKTNPGIIRKNFLDSVYETSVIDNIEVIEGSIEILDSLTAFFDENEYTNPLVVKALKVYAQRRFNDIDALKNALKDLKNELYDYLAKNQPKAAAPPHRVPSESTHENFDDAPNLTQRDKELEVFDAKLNRIIGAAKAATKDTSFQDIINETINLLNLWVDIQLYVQKKPALSKTLQLQHLLKNIESAKKDIEKNGFAMLEPLRQYALKNKTTNSPDFGILVTSYYLQALEDISNKKYDSALDKFIKMFINATFPVALPTQQNLVSSSSLLSFLTAGLKDFLKETALSDKQRLTTAALIDLCNQIQKIILAWIHEAFFGSTEHPGSTYNEFLDKTYIFADYYAAFKDSSIQDLPKITRSSSKDEISKAYRKLAMKHHPDRGGNAEHFKEILAAYEILSDQKRRELYDIRFDQEAKKK